MKYRTFFCQIITNHTKGRALEVAKQFRSLSFAESSFPYHNVAEIRNIYSNRETATKITEP